MTEPPPDDLPSTVVPARVPGDPPAPAGAEQESTVIRPLCPETQTQLAPPAQIGSAGTATVPPAPRQFGRYQVIRELGRGGMGVVFLALDPTLKRQVALKILPTSAAGDDSLQQRFRREAEAVARLVHPNVVTVYEVGEFVLTTGPSVPYYAMEFVPGRSFAEEIHRRQRLAPAVAMRLVRDVARGVACAHAQGIVHRDIKPENILLAGETDAVSATEVVPKLADFGLARVASTEAGARLTATRVVMGTPAYMAPEQANGDADLVGPCSDIYALGSVLYEAVTGCPPYTGDAPMDVVLRKLRVDPPPPRALLPTLAADVQTVILKAMERDPQRRYGSASDFADDLGRCIGGEAILARPPSRLYRLRRWIARNRILTAAAAALLIATLGIAALLADRAIRELNHATQLEEARQAALALQADRRAQATPHFLRGEDAREKARILIQVNDLARRAETLKAAEADYARAIEIDPDFTEAWAGRGQTLAELGDVPGALADLAQAIRGNPRFTQAYLTRLTLRTMEFETLWTKSGKVRDTNFARLTEFPDLRGDPIADRLVEAIRGDVAVILELGIKPEEASYFTGWLRRIEGDRDGALAAFEDSLRIWPYYAPAYEGRATLRLIAPNPDLQLVEKDLQRALKLDPGSLRALCVRLYLRIRSQDLLRAVVDLETMVKLQPRYAPLYLLRGFVRTNTPGTLEQGLEDYREALRLDPSCVLAHLNLGLVLEWQENCEAAIAEYDAALRSNPRHALVYLFRADALVTLKREPEALADLDRALQLDPEFQTARRRRGQLRAARGEFQPAMDDLCETLKANPGDRSSLVLLINTTTQRNCPADAIPWLDTAIEREPKDGELRFFRGSAYMNAGRKADAIAEFEQAIALGLDPRRQELATQTIEKLRRK